VASAATTSLFVLLWSSGAIVSKLGLAQASPFAFLLLRSALALAGLLLIGPLLGLRWPRSRGGILRALGTGCVLLGAYQIFYLLALNTHVTPGVMATVMGVQPILTVVLMERQRPGAACSAWAGLGGLVMVVYQGINLGGVSWLGMLFALLALASMTCGSILQKRITDNPWAPCRCSTWRALPCARYSRRSSRCRSSGTPASSARCCGWGWWSRCWPRCCCTG
jgi:drug/metabolite transporter (DMT)-like permease